MTLPWRTSALPQLSAALAVAVAAASGCTSPQRAMWNTLRDAETDRARLLAVSGGHLREVAISLKAEELPTEVARAVDHLMPDGTLRGCYAIYRGGDDEAPDYRVTKEYEDIAPGAGGRWRSTRFGNDGSIHERSHSLALADVPERVREVLVAALPGDLGRIDVVQAATGSESYQALGDDAAGSPWLVRCDHQGYAVRRESGSPALLWVTR